MIVRCGRCRAELEIAAPGEFICPACGTRNAVRGADPGIAGGMAGGIPGGISGPGAGGPGGLTVPGGGTMSPPPPSGPEPTANWATCPACAWRFAHGEAETLTCPSCRASLIADAEGLRVKT